MKIVLATRNQGKAREIERFLAGFSIEVSCVAVHPNVPEVEETGETFAENALLKARTVCKATGEIALADDSGLCVDALGGAPGVRSARYAGQGATDEHNNEALLQALKPVPQSERTARFECVLAWVEPNGREELFKGSASGRILTASQGNGGFGYDPLFFHEGTKRTFAELSSEEKLRYSHRGAALGLLRQWLEERFSTSK